MGLFTLMVVIIGDKLKEKARQWASRFNMKPKNLYYDSKLMDNLIHLFFYLNDKSLDEEIELSLLPKLQHYFCNRFTEETLMEESTKNGYRWQRKSNKKKNNIIVIE